MLAPPPGGRQLNATEPIDIGGPAGAIMGRTAHFLKGATSSGMSSMPGMGDAADAAGAGEAAGGIGEGLAELAPLALTAA